MNILTSFPAHTKRLSQAVKPVLLQPSPDQVTSNKEPLPEALVELPHALLDVFEVHHDASGLAASAHLGVAGLAVFRAAQCFVRPGLESKLEGASALGLATASVASMLPGGLALAIGGAAHAGHGLLELGLGVNETVAAFKDKNSDWKDVTMGTLGAAKGLAVLAPMLIPSLEHVGHFVELGALVGRVGLAFAKD